MEESAVPSRYSVSELPSEIPKGSVGPDDSGTGCWDRIGNVKSQTLLQRLNCTGGRIPMSPTYDLFASASLQRCE